MYHRLLWSEGTEQMLSSPLLEPDASHVVKTIILGQTRG